MMPDTRMGIAGGIEPENAASVLDRAYKTLKEPASIDAESKLRQKEGGLNLLFAIEYLSRAVSATERMI